MTAQSSATAGGAERVDVAVLRLAGELDVADLAWAAELEVALAGGARHVVVDLLNVTFVDSAVVRALLRARRALDADDGWLRVVYTHHMLGRVIEICGLNEVFPQHTTVDAALRGAPTRHLREGTLTRAEQGGGTRLSADHGRIR